MEIGGSVSINIPAEDGVATPQDHWQAEYSELSRQADASHELVRELIANHPLTCIDASCPFSAPHGRVVITDRFVPESDGPGGWHHRNLTSHIGWIGEYLGHLAVPEIHLHGGTGLPNTAMDGTTPRGDAEIKTATPCAHGLGETRVTFTVRASQRREHALPCICIALDDQFLRRFRGRRIVLPDDAAELALHIEDVYLIPLAAYPTPERCFIIPGSLSTEDVIRSIQALFRTDFRGLRDLGLEGLCRIRGIFDRPEAVHTALQYVDVLGPALGAAERRAYQLNPHRLLADSEAFARGVSLNETVAEAIALQTLARRRAGRERERAAAERELFERDRERQQRLDRALRQELAWALLGVLTLAAGYPVSAVDMRWKYGLRRDTYYPPAYNREAREHDIAVCIEGERRRVRTGEGTRVRRLTQSERKVMETRLERWTEVVRRGSDHPFACAVLDRWRERAPDDPIARRALELLADPLPPVPGPHQAQPATEPVQLTIFSPAADDATASVGELNNDAAAV